MLEPRGHADMYGAILTEPVTPGSHAGVLFMHNEGYSTMCGHGIIAVTTMAIERGLLMPGGDGDDDRLRRARRDHSGAGEGAGRASKGTTCASRASRFVNVPSFVLHGGLTVKLASRTIRADVAFGGAFYAIVDSEAAGLPIDAAHLPELRRTGMEIKHAIEAALTIVHPLDPGLTGIYGTIFTGPPSDDDCRSSQRHDLRRRRSRSIALRHRHGRGDGGGRRDGLARSDTAVRPRKPDRHAVQRPRRVAHPGRRARGDRPGDRRLRLDHRRAHVPDRRGGSAARRIQALMHHFHTIIEPV